ncbi:MAG TPA: baseplate J/gp47 family protein, partial [bacterium]|nr:baseplate J/gp47 family protein [bacterium]
MPPGLSAAGLEIARLEDIKAEIEADLRSALGQTINLLPTESLGQYVGIQASKYAKLWELVQDVYNSEDPHNANGVSLDRRVALTGHKRLEGNPSTATVTAFGTQGTLIDIGDLTASVEGDPEAVFVNVEAATIGAGTDEVQTIGFNTTPDEGSFTLIFNGEETTPIDFSDNAAAVQSALNALPNLEGLTVTGSFAADFVVTFEGPFAESPQPLLTVGVNTLETSNVAVSVTITETTPGVFPKVDIDLEATEDGPTQAKAGFLTVIETPIVGLDSISNALDAVPGKDVETDAELKIRREETLANPGTATLDAIVARLREIDEVEDAVGYENFTEAP